MSRQSTDNGTLEPFRYGGRQGIHDGESEQERYGVQTRRHVTNECPSCGRVPHSDLFPAISSMWQELETSGESGKSGNGDDGYFNLPCDDVVGISAFRRSRSLAHITDVHIPFPYPPPVPAIKQSSNPPSGHHLAQLDTFTPFTTQLKRPPRRLKQYNSAS